MIWFHDLEYIFTQVENNIGFILISHPFLGIAIKLINNIYIEFTLDLTYFIQNMYAI